MGTLMRAFPPKLCTCRATPACNRWLFACAPAWRYAARLHRMRLVTRWTFLSLRRQIATGGLHCPDLAQRHQAMYTRLGGADAFQRPCSRAV